MIIKANAKINLALDVIRQREDKYHDLDMVMLPLELHDTVSIIKLPKNEETYVTCDNLTVPSDDNNLAFRAYKVIKEELGIKENFRVCIHKSIPIGAGLAGGSSDAAAVLVGIIKLLKLEVPYEKIIDIANKIGSDVPFCLVNTPSRVKGTGEIIYPINVTKKYFCLLVKPRCGLSTKKVFNCFDDKNYSHVDIDSVCVAICHDNQESLKDCIGNVLEPTAISLLPEIGSIIDILKSTYKLPLVCMTGSGSTVFALSDDEKKLNKIKRELLKLNKYEVLLTYTL